MITGSCLCGAVRWRMEGPYARMSNCHCSMCRKAHAAPFATYIIVERDKYELLSGADAVCIYQSSSRMHRKFCSKCGSVTPFDAGEYEVVPAGCLDDDPGIRPGRHIFVASKAPWHEIVPRSACAGHTANVYPVADTRRATHLRLIMHPAGGIARLHVEEEGFHKHRVFWKRPGGACGLDRQLVRHSNESLGHGVIRRSISACAPEHSADTGNPPARQSNIAQSIG